MPEGLKLSITSDALKRLLEKRVEYHKGRAEKFKARAAMELEDEDDADEEATGMGKYATTMGPGTQSARQRYKHHLNRATVFTFMSENLLKDDYILSEHDLQKLEVMPPNFF